MSDRTSTTTYRFPDKTVHVADVLRETRCPYTGLVINQRVVSRNVSLEGFTVDEEREFISLLEANDYRGINRRFG